MVLTTTNTVTSTVTTTVRVINSVHNNTTNRWPNTLMTISSGLTDFDVLVLFVPDYTNTGRTF
jgi:hypothetical protein